MNEKILDEHKSERQLTEIYSRVCGYIRPVSQWNNGKAAEFEDRITFEKALK